MVLVRVHVSDQIQVNLYALVAKKRDRVDQIVLAFPCVQTADAYKAGGCALQRRDPRDRVGHVRTGMCDNTPRPEFRRAKLVGDGTRRGDDAVCAAQKVLEDETCDRVVGEELVDVPHVWCFEASREKSTSDCRDAVRVHDVEPTSAGEPFEADGGADPAERRDQAAEAAELTLAEDERVEHVSRGACCLEPLDERSSPRHDDVNLVVGRRRAGDGEARAIRPVQVGRRMDDQQAPAAHRAASGRDRAGGVTLRRTVATADDRPGVSGLGQPDPRLTAAVGVLLVEAAAPVVQRLRDAGVEVIVLKGPALARWLERDDRLTTDLDLLVAPAAVATAEQVLTEHGYRSLVLNFETGDRPHHARIWESSAGGVDVDLHWTLIGIIAADAWGPLRRHAIPFDLAGVQVLALDDAGQALNVALHAAQHGRDGASQLEDLAQVLRSKPEVWDEAAELAAELDALAAFVTGLLLDPAGEAVCARLGLTYSPTVETELRSATELPHTALGVAWLTSAESRGQRLRFLVRKVVPPPAVVRSWVSLRLGHEPNSVMLAVAYVWRVAWLAAHAPAGIRAWWAARRRARS